MNRQRLRRGTSRLALLFTLAVLALPAAWFFWPRHADPAAFDPRAVGSGEMRLWRSYYAEDKPRLKRELYGLARRQYGFSPYASLRLARCAGEAARAFRTSTSRAEAQAALPWLEKYYAAIRADSGLEFDAAAAARAELEWWQRRREFAPPAEYARSIAATAAIVYGVPESRLERWARGRAEMMQYRDAHRWRSMTDDEWRHIETGLQDAWSGLHEALRR
jgi:hypothetical protein